MKKEYLGDSVYIQIDNGMLKLTTERGDGIATNEIYLDAAVIEPLINYLKYATGERPFYDLIKL